MAGPEIVDVVYGEGRDSGRAAVLGPIDTAVAVARDAAGLPYAVVQRQQGSPGVIVAHVAWERHCLGLWVYDAQGRRFLEMDLWRLAEDRLFLIHQRGWAYRDDDIPEFAADAGRVTIQLLPDGRGTRTVKPRGDKGGLAADDRGCVRGTAMVPGTGLRAVAGPARRARLSGRRQL
ncbi:hypothetical protein ABT288_08775 [Streptomyces sp. NPDC001093]|uniref:hypothetical protein n=1 Tax=Streptomyces sp. NPDC001093 TaxID=3154376 RepID=UPI003324DD06